MHPVAAQGFAGTVDSYRRSRPSYPPDAVAWLVDALGIGPGRTVVDVGAGTGKFTKLLEATGARVIAVEPLAQMRTALVDELPGIDIREGTAESLPLGDGWVDAITVAQAFHWFHLPHALPEFHRVLRPGGRLGVIWNAIDKSVPWVAELDSIIGVTRVGAPHSSEAGTADLGDWFGPKVRGRFGHVHVHDRASLLDRVQSMSFVAVQPEAVRDDIFARVGALLDTHPQLAGRERFDLPYITEAFWAERR
jgi:SAM-dependent methyltransferase